MAEASTVAALLGTSALPPREARALLAAALGTSREHLVAHPDAAVPDAAAARFGTLATRRAEGAPLAYLLGEQEFFGRAFSVTPAVLVPRPDTETLIDVALGCLAGRAAPRVLDLGTGSGCIAVTLACERPDATVVAVDVSAAALDIARANATRHGATVDLRIGDWFGGVRPGEAYELIVANPPYVAAGDAHLEALRHEPMVALTDGGDGLRCLAAIATAAPPWLAPGGWLALEHGYDQREAVADLLAAAGLREVATTSDAMGHPRVTRGRRA
jgi:release factor glutamine methyltransferase